MKTTTAAVQAGTNSPPRPRALPGILEQTRKALMARFPISGDRYVDDREITDFLELYWYSLSGQDQRYLSVSLRSRDYRQRNPLDALKMWAYDRLDSGIPQLAKRSSPSPLRPRGRRSCGEWWPGQSSGFISAGAPGLGRRR
jgi:hypothetical protein